MTKKILLVDDDPVMGSLLQTLLEIENYQVAVSHHLNENDIFDMVIQEMPDAILMDVHIRQTNGLDILKRIRQDNRTNHIKVLMSSGINKTEECNQAGANGFLMKPYMPDDLINWLKKTV